MSILPAGVAGYLRFHRWMVSPMARPLPAQRTMAMAGLASNRASEPV